MKAKAKAKATAKAKGRGKHKSLAARKVARAEAKETREALQDANRAKRVASAKKRERSQAQKQADWVSAKLQEASAHLTPSQRASFQALPNSHTGDQQVGHVFEFKVGSQGASRASTSGRAMPVQLGSSG